MCIMCMEEKDRAKLARHYVLPDGQPWIRMWHSVEKRIKTLQEVADDFKAVIKPEDFDMSLGDNQSYYPFGVDGGFYAIGIKNN